MKFSSPIDSAGHAFPRALALAIFFAAATSLPVPSTAADTVNDSRSTPGTVVPSTGTAGGTRAVEPVQPPQPRSNAGSLNGPASDNGQCAALRKQYAQSQACFERFRLQNGGLRPGASKHCKQIKNPSLQCGSEIVG